jgi:hypothetical protein
MQLFATGTYGGAEGVSPATYANSTTVASAGCLLVCAPKDVQYVNSTLVHTVLFFFMKKDTVVISNSRQLTGVEIQFARLWDGMDGHIHAHLSGRHGMDQNTGKI